MLRPLKSGVQDKVLPLCTVVNLQHNCHYSHGHFAIWFGVNSETMCHFVSQLETAHLDFRALEKPCRNVFTLLLWVLPKENL